MHANLLKRIALFLIVALSACQPGAGELLTPTLKHATSIGVTKTMEPAPTRKPTLTRAIPSVPGGCLPVSSGWPDRSKSNGYLYVSDKEQKEDYLVDMKSFAKVPLSPDQEKWEGITEITSDGKWLVHDTKSSLVVTKADGKEIMSIPYNWKSQRFHWLNNDELLIYDSLANGDRVPTLVLNPFTGEKKKISRDYPAINWDVSTWNSWAYSFDHEVFRYDPTLQYVIYPLDPQLGETGFAVTDVAKHQIIASLPFADMTSLPVWSPDGQSFVFASSPTGTIPDSTVSDVLLGSPDGHITTLIKMSDYFDSENRIYPILPQNFQWSPDGRYILFVSDLGERVWMVIDVEKKAVFSLCTKGTRSHASWSPSSQYFFVSGSINGPMFLVDIVGKKATQIDNLSPIGWLAK